jgi:hypothetical protein
MEAKALCGRINCPGYGYIGGMIESEMGYSPTNSFITHNLSIVIILFLMKLQQLKPSLKRVGEVNHLTQDTRLIWTIKSGSVEHCAKLKVPSSSCLLKLF